MNKIHKIYKNILVIDDDEGILEAISLVLEDAGYNVQNSSDGNDVFKKVEKLQPDIILLDILLSGNDGRELCKKLKTYQKTKQTPIIMISAHPTAKATIKDYKADGFLAKPFGSDELLATLASFLPR